jgi:uncharacterized membrane protein
MDDLAEAPAPTVKGLVYILENEAMPGILKVGTTSNLAQRVKQLNSSTAVPLPFHCRYAAMVEDPYFVEKRLHAAFAPHRLSPSREFFRVPVECIIAAIELVALETVEHGVDIATVAASPSEEEVIAEAAAVSRAAAESDLIELLARGEDVPQQNVLAERWGVSKGCASKWLAEFEARGLVRRERLGKSVRVLRPNEPLAVEVETSNGAAF